MKTSQKMGEKDFDKPISPFVLITSFVKGFVGTGFIILRQAWKATVNILQLIVYAFLLFALISYFGYQDLGYDTFVPLIRIMVDYWRLFWFAFVLLGLYDDFLRWRLPLGK